MKQLKVRADLPADANEGIEDAAFEPEEMSAASDEAPTQTTPTPAPYQDPLTSWWTAAALAWGTPVRMWSEIVAAAWRPFLPPTPLTAELPRQDDTGADRQSDAPPPAQPAPQAAIRTPRISAPKRPAPGPGRRSR